MTLLSSVAEIESVRDPAAWTGDELQRDSSWRKTLGPQEVRELMRLGSELAAKGLSVQDVSASELVATGLRAALQRLGRELDLGRGIVLLRGLPIAGLSERECEVLYACFNTLLGTMIVQDTRGTLIDRVEDRGISYADIAVRGYTTNAQLTPHCDSGDFLGLLCVRPAAKGGLNRLSSSVSIFNHMVEHCPELLPPLLRGFRYNIRGNGPPGDWVNVTAHRVPVFSIHGGRVSCRFNEKAIKTAPDLPGVEPLTALELAAIDKVVELSNEDAYSIDLMLESGDILLLSNHSVLHNRTAFEDSKIPGEGRLLFRTWVNVEYARPLLDEFADHYNTGPKQGPFVPQTSNERVG